MAVFDLILGPFLLGVVVNIWLYGIMVMQTAMYYSKFPRDHAWVKALVAYLFTVDTLNSAFNIIFLWHYTITLFGVPTGLAYSHWSLNIEPLMTVMLSSTTQCFFAWRIVKLTQRAWLGWFIGFLACVQFIAGASGSVGGFIVQEFARFQELKAAVIVWLVTSAVTDVMITTILCWYLHTHRTGFSKTDDVITRLIRMTMQTGLVVTIWAIINLFFYLFVTTNNFYLFFQLPLCKLYTNSLMSTLNARVSWRESMNPTSNSGTRDTSAIGNTFARPTERSTFQQSSVNPVAVVTTTEDMSDGPEEYRLDDVKWGGSEDVEARAHSRAATAVRFPGTTKAPTDTSTHSLVRMDTS